MAITDSDLAFIQAQISDVIMRKHDDSNPISLMAQLVEINIYQSLVDPVMRYEIVLNDPIGLHVNYPMVGEETIQISIIPTTTPISIVANDPFSDQISRTQSLNPTVINLYLMVSDVRQVYPDDKTRSSIYVVSGYSVEMYYNAKFRVQRAFKDQYSNVVQTVLNDYLNASAFKKVTPTNFESSMGSIPFVIPNMKPFESIVWMTKRAVPTDTTHSLFTFFENFNGYNFQTLQQMIGSSVTPYPLIYISNMTPEARLQAGLPDLDQHTITAISLNKRYSTIEKFIAGFYENELYEVDIYNRRINNLQTSVPATPASTMEKNQLNTAQYLTDAQTNNQNPGTKTRVRYIIGQNSGDDPDNLNYFSQKFGNATRELTALSQISLTVAAPGNTLVQCGGLVQINIPQFHGFNVQTDDDFISGKYIVTELKHQLTMGSRHIMVMTVSKDSYVNPIPSTMKYQATGLK